MNPFLFKTKERNERQGEREREGKEEKLHKKRKKKRNYIYMCVDQQYIGMRERNV